MPTILFPRNVPTAKWLSNSERKERNWCSKWPPQENPSKCPTMEAGSRDSRTKQIQGIVKPTRGSGGLFASMMASGGQRPGVTSHPLWEQAISHTDPAGVSISWWSNGRNKVWKYNLGTRGNCQSDTCKQKMQVSQHLYQFKKKVRVKNRKRKTKKPARVPNC